MSSLLQIRDEAFQESARSHDRMKFELAVFRNEGYKEGDRIGNAYVQVDESLMPMITSGCIRLIPAFREQIAEIKVESDLPAPMEEEQYLVETLSNWDKMYEEVDDEGGKMRAAIYRNLTVGNNIDKIRWHPERKHVSVEGINPCNFAPDPKGIQSNFSDADYVCQVNWVDRTYVKHHYPNWTPKTTAYGTPFRGRGARHRVDEIWMRRDCAEDVGIDVSGTNREIIVAKLIDDVLYNAQGSPYWYPDFPYAHWRNFLDLLPDGKNHGFWGYGYGTLCWTQQKMIDEFTSNFLLILRNLGIGRMVTEEGVLDTDQMTSLWGAVIELNEGKRLDQARHLPPEQIPPEIMGFVEFISGILTDMMPSNSPVFAGEAPFSNISGRAINSLQFANFNQLSDNIREMNEYRLRRKRIRLSLVQQFARKPLRPHLWRGGLDMKTPFPDDARHIGYKLSMPDLTQLPNTPAGRMEVLNQMAAMGYYAKNPLELLGVTRGYGWTMDDFIQVPVMPQQPGAQLNTTVATGAETAMPSER